MVLAFGFTLALVLPVGLLVLRFIGIPFKPFSRTLPLAIPVGLSVLPAALFVMGHVIPIQSLYAAMITCLLSLLFWLGRGPLEKVDTVEASRSALLVAFVFLAMIGVVVFWETSSSPILYPAVGDYPKHFGMLQALQQKVLPPENPFFRPGDPVRLSYYYLFHLLPAAVDTLPGVSSSQAFAAAAVFTGFGTLVILHELFRLRWIALLTVILLGGLEMVPLAQQFATSGSCTGWIDCWFSTVSLGATTWSGGGTKVHHFLQAMLWLPQHLNAAMIVFVLIWLRRRNPNRFWVLFPSMVLTMCGSSAYIVFASIGFFVAQVVHERKMSSRSVAGVVAALALVSWLAYEIRPSSNAMTVGLSFGIPASHIFSSPESMVSSSRILQIGNFLLLLVIGLGPAVIVGATTFKEKSARIIPPPIWLGALGAGLIGLFVQTPNPFSPESGNDLGRHSLFLVQLILTVWAGISLARIVRDRRFVTLCALVPLLTVSFLSTFHEVWSLGPHRIAVQMRPSLTTQDFTHATMFLRSNTSPEAIVQAPVPPFSQLFQFSERRSALLDEFHGGSFNVDRVQLSRTKAQIDSIFENLQNPKASEISRQLKIDYLFLRKVRVPTSLGAGLRQIYANDTFVVLALTK
jgi:hypothetical protein